MLKKLFAATLCGTVIASYAPHADAAGPGGMARGFQAIERRAIVSLVPLTSADRIDVTRDRITSALDAYFEDFAQSHNAD